MGFLAANFVALSGALHTGRDIQRHEFLAAKLTLGWIVPAITLIPVLRQTLSVCGTRAARHGIALSQLAFSESQCQIARKRLSQQLVTLV